MSNKHIRQYYGYVVVPTDRGFKIERLYKKDVPVPYALSGTYPDEQSAVYDLHKHHGEAR